jgi:hypothetical protein
MKDHKKKNGGTHPDYNPYIAREMLYKISSNA